MVFLSGMHSIQVCHFFLQGDIEKGLEMKKLVLSGFLASEEIYINQLEALLLVSLLHRHTNTFFLFKDVCDAFSTVMCCNAASAAALSVVAKLFKPPNL